MTDAVNYGRIAIIPKGDYSAGTSYQSGDVVSYGGASYLCKGQPPMGTLPTDTNYWQVSAEKGDKGDKGDPGEKGDKGEQGPAGGTNIDKNTMIIPTDGWQEAAVGQYSYSLSVSVSGVTAQDIVSGNISIETESIAQACNLANQCQSGNGTITFYAESVPSGNMTFEYYVLKSA